MRTRQDLIRQLPDLDVLVEQLEDAEGVSARAFAAEKSRRRVARRIVLPTSGSPPSPAETPVSEPPFSEEAARQHYLAAGARAIKKMKDQGTDADLDGEEIIGLEAIVQVEGRPAILIQDGRFFPPPIKWQILEQVREQVEMNCRSVGRIEVTGHPSFDWVGTGFLVGEGVIMTNRHVADAFCRMGKRRRWSFQPRMAARIDYREELGSLEPAEFVLNKVIGVHEQLDLALLKVEPESDSALQRPAPLSVASQPPSEREGRLVYCVGYPAWDGRRNDPDIMRRIFSNIFDVKRLQPGEIMAVLEEEPVFTHDCSTLGGNSGSCVIDLETNSVVGLHFGGRYQEGNYAVAMWQLTGDPLLKKGKVNFV